MDVCYFLHKKAKRVQLFGEDVSFYKRNSEKFFLTLIIIYYIIKLYDYSQKEFCYFINT